MLQQPEKCDSDTIKLEDRDDVVLQELVPYWPITDTVKMGMHVFSEQSEVKTEFEQVNLLYSLLNLSTLNELFLNGNI